jgi:hypothetical protein
LIELRARFSDCLCRRCLTAATAPVLPAERMSHSEPESNSTAAVRSILPQPLP